MESKSKYDFLETVEIVNLNLKAGRFYDLGDAIDSNMMDILSEKDLLEEEIKDVNSDLMIRMFYSLL